MKGAHTAGLRSAALTQLFVTLRALVVVVLSPLFAVFAAFELHRAVWFTRDLV